MTTAHRPTFDPARGGTGKNEGDLSKLSQQYSSRDMPSHNKLKYRQKGQAHPDDVSSRDLRGEIEFRESQSKDRSGRVRESSSSTATSSSKKARWIIFKIVFEKQRVFGFLTNFTKMLLRKIRHNNFRRVFEQAIPFRFDTSLSSANVDADDPLDDIDDSDDSDSDSDDDAELMAELERIKKERAAEKALKEQKEQEAQVCSF